MTKWLLAIGVAAVVAAWWFWQGEEAHPPELQAPVAEPVTPPIARTAEPLPTTIEPVMNEVADAGEATAVVISEPEPTLLPVPTALENSDSSLRSVAAELAPALSRWLLPEHQLRKWVLAVDLLADGKLPKRYRPLSYDMPAFIADRSDSQLRLSQKNYARADALVNALVSIEAQRLMDYYRAWYPLLEKAYAEQGKKDRFEQRLLAAIDRVLAVEAAPLNASLSRPSVLYKYADEALENRSDVEKLLWRMGDDNRLKLQAWLKPLRQSI